MKPLTSVIIPVYNNWKYTKSLIKSLLAVDNIEIIVIDSASTDATQHQMAKIVDKHDNIIYHRHLRNLYVN